MTSHAIAAMAVQSRELLAATKKIVRRADHLNVLQRARNAMLPIATEP